MHCHLLIPGLFFPQPPGANVYQELYLPALEMLLSRSRRESSDARDAESWLFQTFGIANSGDRPVAALTLLADGGRPEDHYWLRADPVHLQPERTQLILADSDTLPISQHEALELADSLNRHFAGAGMIFYPLRPNRWYLRLENTPRMETHSLTETAGKDINRYLPFGPDGMRWHSILNEIQMLFHAHPVNEAREARGAMPINSIWLWGGGKLPIVAVNPFNQIWANDPLAEGLALAAGCSCSRLPDGAAAWLEQASGNNHLVLLDSLQGAVQYGDWLGWQQGLRMLEQTWFTPLYRALRRKKLSRLTIHAAGDSAATFALAHNDLWKLWRRSRPLAHFATEIKQ